MKNPQGKTKVATINEGVVVDGGVTVKLRVGVVRGVVDDEGGQTGKWRCGWSEKKNKKESEKEMEM